MFTTAKIALSAAIVLGALGTAALAESDHENQSGGSQVQTWKDIEQSRLAIQRQIQQVYGTSNASNAYAYVPHRKPSHVR
jgi:hypothetical protein